MATSRIPTACQSIATRLAQERLAIQALQAQLNSAAPEKKARLMQLLARREDVASSLRLFTQTLAVRFHNLGGGDHRHSTVDMRRGGTSLGGFPKDLGLLTSDWADLYLDDINSRSIQVLIDTSATPPLTLKAIFETDGPAKIAVNNLPDKDLTLFTIRIDLDLGLDVGRGLLKLVVGRVQTQAIVKGWLWGTSEDTAIESAFNTQVAQVLGSGGLIGNLELTRQVLGSGWNPAQDKVRRVQRVGDNWEIDFSKPPLLSGFSNP
jgi:hypothetical protein